METAGPCTSVKVLALPESVRAAYFEGGIGREAATGRARRGRQGAFPRKGKGNAPARRSFLSDARHFAETGDTVVDVGVGAEQLGHAAAEEGGDDEHFRRGGVAVLHGDALVP